MAFSGLTARSKSQDSPVLWLAFVAGSLVVHLAAILIGRWYFSQTASPPVGVAQAPLDFVEVDPNAPPLKRPQPITPPNPTAQTSPKAPPPQPEPPQPEPPQPEKVEPSQSSSVVQSLSRQAVPERSSARSTPETRSNPVAQPNRSQPEQRPTDQTTTPRSPTPRPTSNPDRTNPSQPPNSSTTGNPSSGSPSAQPQTETPSNSTTGNPNNSTTDTPANPSTGDPNSPATSGNPLSISTEVQGEIYGSLSEVLYRPEQYARGTVTLKSPPKLAISFDYPSQLPVNVLDLQVGMRITKEGQVVDSEVLDSSPSLQQDARLRERKVKDDIQSIVQGLILNANGDGSLAFEMNLDPKSSDLDAYRILNIRVYIKQ